MEPGCHPAPATLPCLGSPGPPSSSRCAGAQEKDLFPPLTGKEQVQSFQGKDTSLGAGERRVQAKVRVGILWKVGAGGDKQPGPHGNAAIIFRRRENADETVGIWILNVTQQLLSPFSTRGTNLRAAPGDGDLQRPPAPTKNELHRPEAGET